MLTWVAKKLFGTSNDRAVKRMQPLVARINQLEDSLKKLSDAELQAKTPEFKQKLENGATLDDILVEAFAVCREALSPSRDRMGCTGSELLRLTGTRRSSDQGSLRPA